MTDSRAITKHKKLATYNFYNKGIHHYQFIYAVFFTVMNSNFNFSSDIKLTRVLETINSGPIKSHFKIS